MLSKTSEHLNSHSLFFFFRQWELAILVGLPWLTPIGRKVQAVVVYCLSGELPILFAFSCALHCPGICVRVNPLPFVFTGNSFSMGRR